jgi:hypothetical protein
MYCNYLKFCIFVAFPMALRLFSGIRGAGVFM